MRYTYTVRGVNKDSVLSLGYNKTGVSAVGGFARTRQINPPPRPAYPQTPPPPPPPGRGGVWW